LPLPSRVASCVLADPNDVDDALIERVMSVVRDFAVTERCQRALRVFFNLLRLLTRLVVLLMVLMVLMSRTQIARRL